MQLYLDYAELVNAEWWALKLLFNGEYLHPNRSIFELKIPANVTILVVSHVSYSYIIRALPKFLIFDVVLY